MKDELPEDLTERVKSAAREIAKKLGNEFKGGWVFNIIWNEVNIGYKRGRSWQRAFDQRKAAEAERKVKLTERQAEALTRGIPGELAGTIEED